MIAVRRVYEPARDDDGVRVLVDRLWPRGISKQKGRIDLWLRDIAPSDPLRKCFHGKPDDWDSFCQAYFVELEGASEQPAAKTLFGLLGAGQVTLLYAARDQTHNNAVALSLWLKKHFERAMAH